MLKASDKFEQQIQRVHELIEGTDADVTWNDRIPDPDNPEQSRQIDVSIRKNGKLTLVECRIHKSKQDVKWIEELIGRKASLDADAVIAVSASGFTKGAILKADKYGIILRDVLSLTEDEIKSWGNKTSAWLTFYEYKNVDIMFVFSELLRHKIVIDDVKNYLAKHPDKLYGLFESISNALDEENIAGKKAMFRGELIPKDIEIEGVPPKQVNFSAVVRTRKQHLSIPSVVVYDSPEVDALERNVFVETVGLGDFEITQSKNMVTVALDFSPVSIPPDCHFRFVQFDFKRIVTLNDVRVIGLPEFIIPMQSITLRLEFV